MSEFGNERVLREEQERLAKKAERVEKFLIGMRALIVEYNLLVDGYEDVILVDTDPKRDIDIYIQELKLSYRY